MVFGGLYLVSVNRCFLKSERRCSPLLPHSAQLMSMASFLDPAGCAQKAQSVSGLGAGPTKDAIGFSRTMFFSFRKEREAIGEVERPRCEAAEPSMCRPRFLDAASLA